MVAGSCCCCLVSGMVRDPKKDEAKANFSADLAQARKDSEEATSKTQVAPHIDSEFTPEEKHCPMCGEEFCKLFKCKWLWGIIIIALAAWYFLGKG